jgi:flagellar biogenesis protein FliO
MKKQTTARRRPAKRKPAPGGLAAFLAPAAAILKPLLAFLLSARIQRRVRRMHLVERLALGNKHSVTVLRVDGREFMIGCTGESMVLLSALGVPSEAAPAQQVPTKEDLERAFRRVQ